MRYIGCKTLLLDNIKELIEEKAPEAESFCDVCSGTATVARYFKQQYEIYSNDLLYFSYVLQKATIENDAIPAFETLKKKRKIEDPILWLNEQTEETMQCLPQEKRFFQNTYSPNGGRMYMTDNNALQIDFARNTINEWKENGLISENEYFYLVACVVEGIPFISNISGTYGAFHKTWDPRALKQYKLCHIPITTNGKRNRCFCMNGADMLKRVEGDILYIDPPYNARQYLPNYHVLETAARYDNPTVHGITGLRPSEGQQSDFCKRAKAVQALNEMLTNASFKHIILSYSTDGLMSLSEIEHAMKQHGDPGTFEVRQIPYRRYKNQKKEREEELKELLIYVRK